MNYVLDTNIITAWMKDHKGVVNKLIEITEIGKEIFISAISYYEIKRGLLDRQATAQMKKFDLICREVGILLLDNLAIFDKASDIWARLKPAGRHKEDGDADILIAATAIRHKLIVVSDDSDFQSISGVASLVVENWLREKS